MGLLLGRAGPCAPEDPGKILPVQGLGLPLRRDGRVHPFCLPLQITGVIFRVTVQLPAVYLQDPAGHLVQKIPVVGDHQERAAVPCKEVLQPLDHGAVQMVGGLVQDQKIRRSEEGRRQGCPLSLSAGQRVRLPVRLCDPEAFQHGPRLAGSVPVLMLSADGAADVLQDGQAVVELRVLGKKGDPKPVGPDHLSFVRLQRSGDDGEEGGFPGPVHADDAETVFGIDPSGHAVQQKPVLKAFRNIFQCQDIRHQQYSPYSQPTWSARIAPCGVSPDEVLRYRRMVPFPVPPFQRRLWRFLPSGDS